MENMLYKYLGLIISLFTLIGCNELDLEQLDGASSGNWFSTKQQFRESLNDGYKNAFWSEDSDRWTDDYQWRNEGNEFWNGTIDSEWGTALSNWSNYYKAIARVNTVVAAVENQNFFSPEEVNQILGEANFLRATYWAYLITHYGDVPYFEKISMEEAYEIGRTSKDEIKLKLYEFYDQAANSLPLSYSSGIQYATKGAALAYKARLAIHMGDYKIASEAAKACIDLDVYDLHSDFGDYFLSKTKNSPETIFQIPRDNALNVTTNVRHFVPRTRGGYIQTQPTWQLLASYECIDGLPIDESPLFDPNNPFKNRDPRLLATIVPFGSLEDGDGRLPSDGFRHLDFECNPHPNARMVLDYATGEMIVNNDTSAYIRWASFNGLMWRKGVDLEYADDQKTDSNRKLMRFADVLLMYAEAKIELNQIDNSVLDAMNEVRERAYGGGAYPAIVAASQSEMRLTVRNERRAEFALEGLRFGDLIRWRLAEKALKGNIYGMLDVTANTATDVPSEGALMDKVVNTGKWFWGLTPEIDSDGLPKLDNLLEADLCKVLTTMNWDNRQYLFPIPNKERELNANLTQNEGY